MIREENADKEDRWENHRQYPMTHIHHRSTTRPALKYRIEITPQRKSE